MVSKAEKLPSSALSRICTKFRERGKEVILYCPHQEVIQYFEFNSNNLIRFHLIYLFLLNSLKSKLFLSSKIDVQTERFISFIFRGARNSKVLASRTVLWCDIQTGGSDPPVHRSINYIKSHSPLLCRFECHCIQAN